MKRKFVKVMLFGALTLATTATITSCKDYDDDVANLQEQIDKITSTSPVSTEDMKAAISSAKSDLESQLATLKSNLENKDALISDLSGKVSNLEKEIENAADKETVNQLTKDLAAAKTELDALTKLQASDVEDLQGQITALEELVNTLNGLKDSFATKAELEAYVTSEGVKGIISDELAAALGDNEKIATAINDAIKAQVLVKFGSLDDVAALAGENGTVAQVITKLYDAINNDKTGILARLVALEDYKKALEDKAKEEGFDGGIEAVIEEVASLQNSFGGIYASEGFKSAVSEEVKAAIGNQLIDATTAIGKLQKDLEDLGIAINGMIQSVVYIPTTIDRSVDFYTLYAKKTQTANYEVAAKSVSTQELNFRISPAVTMTAEEFNAKYDISLNAEERNWTRANTAEPFAVKVKSCDAGILTVELTTSSSMSHAISLNIASKADAEGNTGLTPTNINSDYIAVIQSNYYLKTAYYKVDAAFDGKIQYNEPAPVDYSTVGTLMISYATSATGAAEQPKEFSKLDVEDIFTTKYTLDGVNKNLFNISATGSVSLKDANKGLVDLITKSANVKVEVESTYYLEASSYNPNTLGTVKIVGKTLEHEYAAKELDWFNVGGDEIITMNTVEIYRDVNVNIDSRDYEALVPQTLPTTGVRFACDHSNANALTLIIPQGTATGDYEAKVVFESQSSTGEVLYTLTVTAPVKVKPIVIDKLAKVDAMWSVDKTTTGFTPVTNAPEASNMTANFAITTSFSNLEAVKTAVEAKGGTFTITTNAGDIDGVTYDPANYTFNFDKDDYTGKMTVGGVTKDAQVQFTIKVNYNGSDEETVTGNVEVNNISGTWAAPANRSFELTDKMKTYDEISKGFAWTDLRGKTMWAEGTSVTGDYKDEKAFAAGVQALGIYGLEAPKFVWSADSKTNPDGSAETYLTLDEATGKITFTEEGKTHKFYRAVSYTIEVQASSKWGKIANYGNSKNNEITITIPAEN